VRGLLVVAVLVVVSLLVVPFWLILRPEDSEAVLVNGMWCVFNLVLMIAALLVAFEQPQLRIAHRLPRHLPATIYSADRTWSGETINVSETGALIAIDGSPNLPDEVEVELVGDYGARAFLNGRIIRKMPVSDTQTHLAVDFVDSTQAQQDALVLVIYSDVKEWYSQKRENVDDPLGSLKFLATSLTRSFQDFKPYRNSGKIRKRVRAAAQLYWQGDFYPGEATEIGANSVRLELYGSTTSSSKMLQSQDLEKMQEERPLVGLLFSQEENDPLPRRLLAQIIGVEVLSAQESSDSTQRKFAIELEFPEQFKQRQGAKIKELLKVLK
jgi:cellulose synthase (UDP-forming)